MRLEPLHLSCTRNHSSYFHSVMTYGLIFWENCDYRNIILDYKQIRIIMSIRDRDSCRKYFRELKILPLKSQDMCSLSLFIIKNRHHFEVNSKIHNINSRTKSVLHEPSHHLSLFLTGTYHAGFKVFNSSPISIKYLSHNT
jgi:hypothetical protein